MTDESPAMRHPYEIVSIRRAEPPPRTEGSVWHRYEIAQGTNTINGCRQGDLKTVTEAVEEIVTQLNERRLHRRGRVHLVMTSKKKTHT